MKYFILLHILVSILFAYNNQVAQNNLANDYAKCAVFFYLSYERTSNSNMPNTANRFKKLSANAVVLAKNNSNAITTDIRMHIEMDRQYKLIKQDSSFITILDQYEDVCKVLMVDPDRRFRYWVNKE